MTEEQRKIKRFIEELAMLPEKQGTFIAEYIRIAVDEGKPNISQTARNLGIARQSANNYYNAIIRRLEKNVKV